jgi:hypothetical protein
MCKCSIIKGHVCKCKTGQAPVTSPSSGWEDNKLIDVGEWESLIFPNEDRERIANEAAKMQMQALSGLFKAGEEIDTNERGGKQSKLDVRYDLMPPDAMERLAQVLAEGAKKYSPKNWMLIDSDDHINHALNHIFKYLGGEVDDDHIGHALCRMMMAVQMVIVEGKQ